MLQLVPAINKRRECMMQKSMRKKYIADQMKKSVLFYCTNYLNRLLFIYEYGIDWLCCKGFQVYRFLQL